MKRLFLFHSSWLLLAACGPAESSPGAPAASVKVIGDVMAFMNEVGGERVEGARVSILEQPEKSVVTGPDAHFEFDGLAAGSEVTLVMEHPDYHTTQTGTFVLGEHGIHPFTIQAASNTIFGFLSNLVPTQIEEDNHCIITTTVTRSGGSLFVHLRQGEAGAAVALSPAAPAESGPIYFDESVLPDPAQTATSKDGGVVFINVPPGEYTVSAAKPGLVFDPVRVKCRAGTLVNAGPPLGVLAHVVGAERGGGAAYPDDDYSASTAALCERTAECVNAANAGHYPPATVASCKAMFKDALSFVDARCDAGEAFRGAWKTLFDCRASSCDLALGGDSACAAEDAAFVGAMAAYGACYADQHQP